MFTELSQLITEGSSLHINIMKTNGKLAVLVVPQSGIGKDQALENLIPLTLNGTPEELDAGFLSAIYNPVMKMTGLISNIAAFEKAMEKTVSESKVEKDKKDVINKLVKDAEALDKENKLSEALAIYKKALELDKNNSKLQLKVNTLKQKTGQKDMFFNVSDVPVAAPVKQPENTPIQTGYIQKGTQPAIVQQAGNNASGIQQSVQYQTEHPQTNCGNTQSGNAGYQQGSQQRKSQAQKQNPIFTDNNTNPNGYCPEPNSMMYNIQHEGYPYAPAPNSGQINPNNDWNRNPGNKYNGVSPDYKDAGCPQAPDQGNVPYNNENRQPPGTTIDLFEAVLNS